MDSMETTQSTTPPATEPTPPPPLPLPQSLPPSSSTLEISTSPSLNPNPNSTQNPSQNPQSSTQLQQQQQHSSLQQSQTRPQLNRVRPQSPYSQFPPHLSSSSSSTTFSPSLSSPASPSISTTSMQRGGLAIGVPAHQARPPSSQPTSFSTFGPSSFNQQFGGLGRNPVNDSNTNQAKQAIQGIQTIGMIGSLSSGSQIRPSGLPQHNQQRALHPSMRSQSTPTNQPIVNQKFQGHGLLRAPSMGSPSAPSPGTPQSLQPHTQPWMSSASQGKQMHQSLPSSSYRQQIKPQSLQQRSHIPQPHHHPLSTASHQQMASSQQQQPMSQLHQSQEHYGQQYPLTRVPQSMPHQQQATRGLGSGNQKTPPTSAQAGVVQSGAPNTVVGVDAGESSNHIISKRSIHELVSQIDPSEKLDPEVEDILVEIAEDFVDSITTVGCSLAKHRKSTTLEAKDILLHLERNWNMTLPGFGGDEIKSYKKQLTNDIHKERLAAVKKSMVGPDTVNMKGSTGQTPGNAKGHVSKAPTTGSPKARESL